VDEHRFALDAAKPCTNRVRALNATLDQCADIKPVEGFGGLFVLTSPDDHAHGAYCGVPDQRFHGPTQHRLAAEHPILLGHAATKAFAFSGGDDERGGGHGGAV
jgi:hypothetical protein